MTMLKPIAIDLDDVLGPFSVVLRPALNALTGKSLSYEEWTRYDIFRAYGITLEQFLHCIISNHLLEKIPPCVTAFSAVRAIRRAGHPAVIITSRGYHPQGEQVTRKWLSQHIGPVDGLIVVPEGVSKGEIARARYPQGFHAMVDDFPPNLDSMVKEGLVTTTGLINKPWNQGREDYQLGKNRFDTIGDFVQSLSLGQKLRIRSGEERHLA